MILYIDVLCASVEDWIVGQSNGALVVFFHIDGFIWHWFYHIALDGSGTVIFLPDVYFGVLIVGLNQTQFCE